MVMEVRVQFELPTFEEDLLDPLLDVIELTISHRIHVHEQGVHPIDYSYRSTQLLMELLQLQHKIINIGAFPSEDEKQDMIELWLKLSSSCIGALEELTNENIRTAKTERMGTDTTEGD